MVGKHSNSFFASIIVAICFLITLAAPANAQLNNPDDCPAFNRNWQCTAIGTNPAPFTTCVQTVVNGVVTDQRTRTFNGEAAFNKFLTMAPAGTVYQQCGATPSCTQTTQTRTSTPCPAGQQGLITETRTLNTGGVCNATSAWTIVSNTCGPCTQTTETRTLACPSGQIGEIVQTRTLNTGGVCGSTSAYVETSNTCRVPPSNTCVNPFGGTLQVGQSITAFRTLTTPFGTICESEVRVCQSNGTLSGSFTFQTCSVNPPQTCALPWGGTIANGQSVTAYKTSTTPFGTICESQTRTCTNGVLSGTFTFQVCNVNPPVTCALPWGGTLQVGQSVTAYQTSTTPFGTLCASQTRTCQADGTLSGNFTFQTCSVNPPQTCALPWGGVIANGQSVTAYQTATTPFGQFCTSETRTCVNGVLSGSFTFQTCNPGTPQNCALPWGGTIAHGQSVTAYKKLTVTQASTTNTSATVIAGQCAMAQTSNVKVTAGNCQDIPAANHGGANTSIVEYCLSETRVCNNGVLSGSYTQQTCSANPSCTQFTETRNTTQCPSGQTGVITESRTVNVNGVCGATSSWSVVSNTCQPVTPQTCTTPWGAVLQNGQSVIAYLESNPAFGGTCYFETRVCVNGVLSGSYTKQTCTITPPASCALPWGGTLANGQSVTAFKTSSTPFGQVCESQTRTCNNGNLSGSFTFQTCNQGQPQNCTTPWGTTILNGQSVTAYQTSTTPFGQVCASQTRTCSNGVLSGQYTFQNCNVNPPATCNLPWGGTIANGQSVTAYQTATTQFGQVCQSQTRTCNNGQLSGSYTFQNCSMNPGQSCTLNGQTIAHGQSIFVYGQSNPAKNTACSGQSRTCNNGVLSGSYTYGTCTQVMCARADTSNTSAEACTTTTYNGGQVTGTSTSYTGGQSQSQAQSQSQTATGNGGNVTVNQGQSQAQAQSQSTNVSGNGGGNVVVNQSQSQAQAQSQSANVTGNSGNVNVSQSQAQAQAQEQSVWVRMDAMMTRMLGL